jgi:hypothetical protein
MPVAGPTSIAKHAVQHWKVRSIPHGPPLLSKRVMATDLPTFVGSTRNAAVEVDDVIQLDLFTITGHVAPSRPTGRLTVVVPAPPTPALKVKQGFEQHMKARFNPHRTPGASVLLAETVVPLTVISKSSVALAWAEFNTDVSQLLLLTNLPNACATVVEKACWLLTLIFSAKGDWHGIIGMDKFAIDRSGGGYGKGSLTLADSGAGIQIMESHARELG